MVRECERKKNANEIVTVVDYTQYDGNFAFIFTHSFYYFFYFIYYCYFFLLKLNAMCLFSFLLPTGSINV